MGIPDRIILTLYTFLMAVVAVLVVLCSLGIIAVQPRHYIAGGNQPVSGNNPRQLGIRRWRHYYSAGKPAPFNCRYRRDGRQLADFKNQRCR